MEMLWARFFFYHGALAWCRNKNSNPGLCGRLRSGFFWFVFEIAA